MFLTNPVPILQQQKSEITTNPLITGKVTEEPIIYYKNDVNWGKRSKRWLYGVVIILGFIFIFIKIYGKNFEM